jgi:hypothetical protein
VQSLCAATECEVDLARNSQITESGLDLGYRNRHRSLTHAVMIFCPLTRKSPCEVFGTHSGSPPAHFVVRGSQRPQPAAMVTMPRLGRVILLPMLKLAPYQQVQGGSMLMLAFRLHRGVADRDMQSAFPRTG